MQQRQLVRVKRTATTVERDDWQGEADSWLREWASWMRADRFEIARSVGFSNRSAGFATGGSSSEDAFDHLVDAEDMKVIYLIDRAVRGLDAPHYGAVVNRWLNCVAWFRGDPAQMYVEAREMVWRAVERWR